MDKSEEKSGKQLPDGLEENGPSGEGYEPLVRYQNWRVAVITWADRFDRKNLYRLERHIKTDEVFVLMKGEATLFIGQEGIPVKLKPRRVYNVKCGSWHAICVSPDAEVLICENDDTGADNTGYRKWSPLK